MNKLDLISYALQAVSGGAIDSRVKHYQVKQLTIDSDPQMPVLADGFLLEPGPVTALAQPRALTVMGGRHDSPRVSQPDPAPTPAAESTPVTSS